MQSIGKKIIILLYFTKVLFLGEFFFLLCYCYFVIHLSYFCCCCYFSLLRDLICFVVAVKRYSQSHKIHLNRKTYTPANRKTTLFAVFLYMANRKPETFFQLVFFSFWICIWRKTCFKKDKLPFRDGSLVRYVGCSGM